MEIVLFNGNIRTLDPDCPRASALAVRDGVIRAVGSDEEVLKAAAANAQRIDLKGRLVLPGFTDSHMHILYYASLLRQVSLWDAASWGEAKERLSAALKELPAGKWLVASGMNQDDWSDTHKLPDRHDLDAISSEVPIYLTRVCGHIVCLNTKALELTGFINERPDTTKETIDFGEDGLPNGYIREVSVNRAADKLPLPDISEIKDMILQITNAAAAKGITRIHSDDCQMFSPQSWRTILQAYRELAAEGKLPIRVYEQLRFLTPADFQSFLNEGYRFNQCFGRFKIGPLKVVADGSLGAHSAAMLEPYRNDPGVKGIYLFSDDELRALIDAAYANGFNAVVHCIGDGALEQVLNVLAEENAKYPAEDRRSGIVHCQIMSAAQQDRFKELGLSAYVQPVFIRSDARIAADCVGEEKAAQSYNWRRFLDLGIHMSGGSDCPVERFDPLPNMFYAVTRKPSVDSEPWYARNGVTLDEAAAMFTKEGCYAACDEDVSGVLKPGMSADLTVQDRDIYALPPEEFFNVTTDMTMVEGEIVYRSAGFADLML